MLSRHILSVFVAFAMLSGASQVFAQQQPAGAAPAEDGAVEDRTVDAAPAEDRTVGAAPAEDRTVDAAPAEDRTVDDKAARAAFAEKFIWSFALLGADPGEEVDFTGMYQGTYKEWLSPREFYQEIGRPDLVAALEANERGMLFGGLIMYTGLLGTAAGATWLTVETLGGDDPSYLLPALVTGASVAVLVGGLLYSPDTLQPITQRQAWRLADQHNQHLKEQLGLPEDYSPVAGPESASPPEVSYGLSPTLGGISGGVHVSF